MRTRGRSVSSRRPVAVFPSAVVILGALAAGSCAVSALPPGPPAGDAEPEAVRATPSEWRLEPLDIGAVDDPTEGFLRHCESTLLVRAGAAGQPADGDLRSAWFGALVVPEVGARGHAVAALGDVMLETFRESDPEAARAVEAKLGGPRSTDFEWAVPRLMQLRDRLGAEAFREVLRELVDQGRGGAARSVEDLAALAGSVDEGAGPWVLAWLAGPARARARVEWRFDEGRERLLVRVDQTHTVGAGRPDAYPFTLLVRLMHGDGSLVDGSVEVTARRDLLEVPCSTEPVEVTIDPDGALDGLVELSLDGDASR